MKKPKSKTIKILDWSECIEFLEDKYKFKHRDYGQKYTAKGIDEKQPYLDYWHHIGDTQNPHNGSDIYFNNDSLNYKGDAAWKDKITEYILKEFGKGKNRECSFRVEW